MNKFFICICAAFFTALPFIFPHLSILLFIAPAFYAYVLYDSEKPFVEGFLFGFVFFAINSSFILSLDISWIIKSKILSFICTLLSYIAICSIEGLFSSLFSLAFFHLKKRVSYIFYPFIFSSLWVFYELLTGLPQTALGFPWGRIAIPLAVFPPSIQCASLFGEVFISFIIIFFASSLPVFFKKKRLSFIIFPSLLLAVSFLLSLLLYNNNTPGKEISVSVVQTDFDAKEKREFPVSFLSKDAYSYIKGHDLTLFPEASILINLNNSPYLNLFNETVLQKGGTVLIGALYQNELEENFTSLYMFPKSEYFVASKRHLVPFGEYIPLLNKLIPDFHSEYLSASHDSIPLTNKEIKAGSIICFDSVFPLYSREYVNNGANILCVSTNDSWFSHGNNSRLHLYHSIYRSIENSRFTLRSSSTGVSAIINSKGDICSYLPKKIKGNISGTAILYDNITLYTKYGDTIIIFIAFTFMFFALLKKEDKDD